MRSLYSKPDRYIARTGSLDAVLTEHAIEGAPAFLRGLRALFVTDTHVLRRTSQADIDALIRRVAAAAPDLLLLGGDYSDTTEGTIRLFGSWRALKPALGSYGVIGNNDAEAWTGKLDALVGIARENGIELLINGAVRLAYNGGTLWIGGVDEHLHGKPDAGGLYPERSGPNDYRILLSHYPVVPSTPPDLMLSGHTHGGQFNLLGVTPFSVGFERLKRPRLIAAAVAGTRDIGGMRLLVSKGIGASRLQLRVGVRPEINLLTFEE